MVAGRILLATLADSELDSMSIEKLAARMDEVIRANHIDRYGPDYFDELRVGSPPPVAAFLATNAVQVADEARKRRLVYRYFSLVVQLELSNAAVGLMNLAVYSKNFDQSTSFRSAGIRITKAALDQYTIISSRILVEIFMDLLHDLSEGRPLPTDARSRLRTFKRWLRNKGKATPYVYFAHVILTAYAFDRGLRSPEVHGASKIPRQLLLLQEFSRDQELLSLLNAVLNVFRPLLTILDGARPNVFHGDVGVDWMKAYCAADTKELERQMATLFGEELDG